MRFNKLNLSKELLRAIDDMGFERPSEVQEATIPYILQGNDILAQAQTGTGKTASFGIPMIEKIQDKQLKSPQGLVLVPTRELARQVTEELKKLAKYKRFIKLAAIYGGADMGKQLSQLRNGTSIVVGTPGRIMDHMKRKSLQLDQLEFLVLDEADEMFDMGFRDDMKTIIEKTNPNRQTLFFLLLLTTILRIFPNSTKISLKRLFLKRKN